MAAIQLQQRALLPASSRSQDPHIEPTSSTCRAPSHVEVRTSESWTKRMWCETRPTHVRQTRRTQLNSMAKKRNILSDKISPTYLCYLSAWN
eukprot:1921541-Pleurochrysis_carterae.AAC.5